MHHGIFAFPVAGAIPVTTLARECEDRGFESLWFPDHSHIPVARETPWPGGAELPDHYRQAFDPIASLGAAAAVTSALVLGTGILLLPQRDVIQTAKSIATLDAISGGRVVVGVGVGWNREEMRNHGIDPDRRWALLREKVQALRQIWQDPHAGFEGELVSFDGIDCGPATTSVGGPPILVGGAAPGGIRRAAAWADGWMPLAGRGDSDWSALAAELREAVGAAGRDPDHVSMTVFGAAPAPGLLDDLEQAGVDRVVFALAPSTTDEARRSIDAIAAHCGLGA